MVMVDRLSAAAFGLVPSGQLFARELHAAPRVGLRPEQMPGLVDSCTVYTADADLLMARMAGSVARIHRVMFAEKLPGTAELDVVDKLLVGWSYQALDLGRTWVRHRVNGLRDLDTDQVRRISEVHGAVAALLAGEMRKSPVEQAAA
ncbi:hypothetical protein [Frankia canadensis]|nr:hypothetical protein [Frankia canadensis]